MFDREIKHKWGTDRNVGSSFLFMKGDIMKLFFKSVFAVMGVVSIIDLVKYVFDKKNHIEEVDVDVETK